MVGKQWCLSRGDSFDKKRVRSRLKIRSGSLDHCECSLHVDSRNDAHTLLSIKNGPTALCILDS